MVLQQDLFFDIQKSDWISAKVNIEGRFNNKNYLPSYFNTFYEVDRFSLIPPKKRIFSKLSELNSIDLGNGLFVN